jgi:hypothetical protein
LRDIKERAESGTLSPECNPKMISPPMLVTNLRLGPSVKNQWQMIFPTGPSKNLVLKIMPNVHGTMPFIRSADGLGSKSIPDQWQQNTLRICIWRFFNVCHFTCTLWILFYPYFDWLKHCMFLNVLWSVYWKVACIYLFLYLEIKEKFQPNV